MTEKRDDFVEILSMVSPGTEIRKGLDNIVHAGKGALIVIGDSEEILKLVDGGFYINCDYNPQRIYELAKMDGAIVINTLIKKILYANVQLLPDASIETSESGTRHKTSERFAKQTENLVISISERRKVITLYRGEFKYILRNTIDIMSEANQAIKTLERYTSVLEKALTNLTIMEFDDLVTIYEVTMAIQRFEMVFRIKEEVEKYIVELGTEGRLINMQLEELLIGVYDEMEALVRDYINIKKELEVEAVLQEIHNLNLEDLLEVGNIAFILGHERSYSALDKKIIPRGHRLLGKVLKLTKRDVEKLINEFEEFNNILEATTEDLAEIRGISKFKARSIKNGLNRLKITTLLEK